MLRRTGEAGRVVGKPDDGCLDDPFQISLVSSASFSTCTVIIKLKSRTASFNDI